MMVKNFYIIKYFIREISKKFWYRIKIKLIQFNENRYEKSYTMVEVNSVSCDINFSLLFPVFYFWNRSGYSFQIDNFCKSIIAAR